VSIHKYSAITLGRYFPVPFVSVLAHLLCGGGSYSNVLTICIKLTITFYETTYLDESRVY
jgi:hypothetical protein